MKQTGVRTLTIGGGVAANSAFRGRLTALDADVFLPPRNRCTDNGSRLPMLEDFDTTLATEPPKWIRFVLAGPVTLTLYFTRTIV